MICEALDYDALSFYHIHPLRVKLIALRDLRYRHTPARLRRRFLAEPPYSKTAGEADGLRSEETAKNASSGG